MGHKLDTLSLVWTSHVFWVNWLRLFLSVFCTIYSGLLISFVDVGHVKSLCLLVYFSLSSYSWSCEVCFASFRVYTCLFSVLTSGIKARFNDGVRFSGSIIDDWTRLERCVHLSGVVLAITFFDSNEDFVGEIISERFFVLRHKFCKGDYGEEKQLFED